MKGRAYLLPNSFGMEGGTIMANRRGKGEGSVFHRADGTWAATITVGYNATGKRIRRTVYSENKKEVTDKLTRLQNQKLDGTLSEESKLTVAEYVDRWLEDSVRPAKRASTHSSYKSHVELYIKPHIGSVKLVKLTPAHVAGLYSTMERDGKSARLRQMVHATLHRALNVAIKWGVVVRNVAQAVERPNAPKTEIKVLTHDQARTLLKVAEDDRLHALYVLAVAAGMRSGEMLGLHWTDIDLKAGMLSVRRTLLELGGKHSFGEPKSTSGKRSIPLPSIAVDTLKLHKAYMMQEGHGANPLVFVSEEGLPIKRSDLRRLSFLPLLKLAGLPTIRFHDLRHTSATMLLGEGIHPKIVQERLGHSTISLTMDTYSHVLPSMQLDAADKLNGILKKAIG